MTTDTPPIPARLAARPVVGGLAHPWVNVRLADGGVDYRSPHHARVHQAWVDRLCQACGDPHGDRMVLLCGPDQLAALTFDEAPLHPECAHYASGACPMVAGRMPTYADRARVSEGPRGKTCFEPGCDCDGWVPTPGFAGTEGGEPAHPWFAVWVTGYTVAVTPEGMVHGGVVDPGQVVRVRRVSEPGVGRVAGTVPIPVAAGGGCSR